MRPKEHLAFKSKTRTPVSDAHATNCEAHAIALTPPSASQSTVGFILDKNVFSYNTNLSSPGNHFFTVKKKNTFFQEEDITNLL